MSVTFDESHKKIDTSELKSKRRKKLNVTLGSIVLSLTLLSGCGKTDNVNSESEPNDFGSQQSVSDTFDSDIPSQVGVQSVIGENDLIGGSELDNSVVLGGDYDAFSSKIEVVEHNPKDRFKIPFCISMIIMDDGNIYHDSEITYEDLAKVSSVTLALTRESDCSFLNYMTGLKSLSIWEKEDGCKIDGVDGSRLPDGMDISFSYFGISGSESFDQQKYPFLKDIGRISHLEIEKTSSYDLGSQYINSLNVDQLCLYVDTYSNITSFDFNNINGLTIVGKPYDIAMFLCKSDIDKLNNSSITIKMVDNDDVDITEEVLEICDRLDTIFLSLGIQDDEKDIDKLDKILNYVLNEYTYDPVVKEMDDDDINPLELNDSFYKDGVLYGSMERKTQICGNYAAMMKALCRRAEINSFYLASYDHAWNAIQIGDYYYFVDSTWLDQFSISIEKHEREETLGGYTEKITFEHKNSEDIFAEDDEQYKVELKWYLEDPTEHPDYEGHHVLRIEPYGLELIDIPDDVRNRELGIMVEDETITDEKAVSHEKIAAPESNNTDSKDISDDKYVVTFDGKKYIVPGIILVGLLSSIGVGVLVHKKKVEEMRRRRRLTSSYSDPFVDDFGPSFDDYHNKYR